MHNKNNKWAHFGATLSLLLLLSFAVNANQAPIENINGVPVDMAIEKQLDKYLTTSGEEGVDSKALLFGVLEKISSETPVATRARALSYEAYWHYYEGNTELAFETLDKLFNLAENTELADVKVEALATQLELLQYEGKYGEAFLLLSDIEIHLSSARMPRLRYFAHNRISRVYADWNRYDDALRHLLAAQEAVSETNNERTPIRQQYLDYSIAVIQSELKNWEGALSTINKAIEHAKQHELTYDLPDFYLHKSYVEAGMGDRRASHDSLRKAYDTAKSGERIYLLPTILNNFGDHYMYEKDWEKARSHLLEALELAEEVEDVWMAQTIHFNLGFVEVHQGNTEAGLKEMTDAVQFYRDEELTKEVEAMLGELAQAYEFAGLYQKQAETLKEQVALSKEHYQSDQQKNLANLQQLYETKDKEQQIELLERQNELKEQLLEINKQRNMIWLLLGIVALFATVFVFIMYRKARKANLRLKAANSMLADQSLKDPLTGLWNRRALQKEMDERRKHGERRDAATQSDGLILLDLDFFKRINDQFGHAAGDEVLAEVSRRLQMICRDSDKLIRWGGEEFLFLVRNVDDENLKELSERILNELAKKPVRFEGHEIPVTTTIGFIRLPFSGVSEKQMDWEKVLQVADMALYMGKAHGRNRACGVTELHVSYEEAQAILETDLSEALSNKWISMETIEGPDAPQDPS
ncbi:tetratricopeptide repeat-containing diguanylate cyclase [Idiomarina zobellii]|uniref:tetratricopeptide repeat-containing diguanylate cyclase n=1 Tax=Idiomarina zobellii TaxID=86103 RepID=UPI0006B56FD7|nr:GGDEF domain-containing protein [Idiomarina zobellii]SDG19830.1 diguanylate cyclase (GGDEF) domain-containing protein [Idiomarina zobellii]